MILIVYTFNASAECSQPAACVCQDLHTKFTPDTAEEIFAKFVDLKLGWTKDNLICFQKQTYTVAPIESRT